MICVSELTSVKLFKNRVVFGIWGCEHHMLRTRKFKDNPLKGRQSYSIKMLDDFNNCCSVKAAQPLISVRERALNQIDPLALTFRHTVKTKKLFGPFE